MSAQKTSAQAAPTPALIFRIKIPAHSGVNQLIPPARQNVKPATLTIAIIVHPIPIKVSAVNNISLIVPPNAKQPILTTVITAKLMTTTNMVAKNILTTALPNVKRLILTTAETIHLSLLPHLAQTAVPWEKL